MIRVPCPRGKIQSTNEHECSRMSKWQNRQRSALSLSCSFVDELFSVRTRHPGVGMAHEKHVRPKAADLPALSTRDRVGLFRPGFPDCPDQGKPVPVDRSGLRHVARLPRTELAGQEQRRGRQRGRLHARRHWHRRGFILPQRRLRCGQRGLHLRRC